MPNLLDKYSMYETMNNPGIASTLLWGYLGDKVSEEKKLEIMKKLSLPKLVDDGNTEDVGRIYGKRFEKLTENNNEYGAETRDVSDGLPGIGYWIQPGAGRFYTEPGMEEVLQEFDDGMRELLEVLDEHEKELDLSAPNAGNHYQILKGLMKRSYDGKMISEMTEDPSYGTAVAMTAKIAFEQGTYRYDKNKNKFAMSMDGTATKTVLDETADLGLLEAMAGNVRVHEMLSENVTNGNVSRQELLNACKEQSKRMEKVMELTDEQVEKLKQKNVLQNTRQEYTDGDRGILFSTHDMKAKQELLKAGYPVEDVRHMTAFNLQMNHYAKNAKNLQAELDADKQKYPDPDEDRKKDWDARQKKIDDMKEVAEKMRKIWNEVTNPGGPLTQEKRLENLRKLKTGAMLATEKGLTRNCLEQFPERMDRRMAATLTTGDKAMLAGDYTAMYNALQEADPRTLFTGSRQFKELKKSVKELAEMEQSLSPEARKNNRQFWKKKREVLEKSQTYLRYKNRQMNGPDGHKHKRSDLETKRVQAVDGVYNRLLGDLERETPNIKLNPSEMQVFPKVADKDLLRPPVKEEPKDFDSYVRSHTGKGAMNGTREEMIDDMAKVLAAQIMMMQKPAKKFDRNMIDKAANRMKDKFYLDEISEPELKDALKDGASVKKAAQIRHRKTYGVEPEDYGNYIYEMKRLYRDMEVPDGKDKDYQKIYDTVKKIAHLPKDPEAEGLPMQKVGKLVEQANSEIYEAMDRYIERNIKMIGPNDPKTLQVLNAMIEAAPSTQNRGGDMVDNIREKKGVTDIAHPEYIEMGEYDRGGVYGLSKTTDKLKLSKDYQKEVLGELGMDEREELTYLKTQSQKEARLKEAPAGRKKPGEVLDTKKRSKEAGDKPVKNTLKEKKVDKGVYL